MPIGLFSGRLVQSQLWLVEQVQDGESFMIRNYAMGSVLDIQDGSSAKGTPVIVNNDDHAGEKVSSQHWRMIWDHDDNKIPYYRITNQKTQTVLHQTESTKNGGEFAIESREPDGSESQLWVLERATFPTIYWIINMDTDLCLDYGAKDGVYLNAKTKLPSGSQLWYMEDLVDHEGYCTIRNVNSEDRVLELSGDGTSILGSSATGDDTQRWQLTDVGFNGVITVVCARDNAVLYAQKDREKMVYVRAAKDASTFGQSYQWCLVPLAAPSLFWTTVQCRGSGKFLYCSNDHVTASDGACGEIDYNVQWRFAAQGRNPYYVIFNRHNGERLCASSNTKSSLTEDNADGDPRLYLTMGTSLEVPVDSSSNRFHNADGDPTMGSSQEDPEDSSSHRVHFSLDGAGEDYSITNVGTSHVLTYSKGEIVLMRGGATDTNRQWFINSSLQSVPSFAIINGQTGMAIAYVPGVNCESVTTDTTFNSYRCLWIFQQVGTDLNDFPIYVIINKLSDCVLNDNGGTGVEALDADPKDPHHQWRLVPCHERYFAIVNVATGKCLQDDGSPPEGDRTDAMTVNDRRCCWTLVSYRHSNYDNIANDTDISYPSQKFYNIAKRLPKKHPKGKGNAKSEPSHIPDNPRIRQVDNRVLLDIVERLINQWDIDMIPASQQAGRPVSTSRDEVLRWGLNVPRSLQVGWTRDGWIRIDIRGTYDDQNGVRVANIQGQWNNDTIFHIIVPTGVNFGRARIRQAMHESLRTGSSVRLDVPDNAKAGGTKKPPSTTRKPPGPGAPPSSQLWLVTALSYLTLTSMGLMLL
ncbi:hypothetical protein F5I97DRAFT_1925251 [Phlebopus sp. FC_14]|nr:hypothetical protein F5I97DRAFT_1925251 [Phlebopus sp. FC_14]